MSLIHNLEYRIDYDDGWYDLENDGLTDFHWMKQRASCSFSGLDDSFIKVLKITAGHPFRNEKNPFLSVEYHGKLIRNIEISAGESDYYIPLGATGDVLRIDYKLNKTFESAVTNDDRTLGILVKKMELLNLQSGTYLYGNGWYDEEIDSQFLFRWTDQSASILLAPDLLDRYSFVQFYVESPCTDFSQKLNLSIDGQSLVELSVSQKWSHHIVSLSNYNKKPGLKQKDKKTCVELVFLVNKTIDDRLHPLDQRTLGIKIRDIEFHNNVEEFEIYSFFQGRSQLEAFPRFRRNVDFQKIRSYNLNRNLYEVSEQETTLTSFPISLYVDLNLKCNLSCPSCFRSAPENKGKVWPTMDFTLFEKIAHELFPTALRVILSGGGESILNKNFDKMIELCRYYQTRPILYTNATTLNRARIILLARSGAVMGISIDGSNQKTFETLRYPAKWDTIIRSLEAIKAIREEINNDEFYPYFGVVIQKDNVKELAAFVELAENYGIDLIKFNRLDPYYPELEKKIPDPEEAHKELARALDIAIKKRIRLYFPDYGYTSSNEKVRILKQENESIPIKMDIDDPDRFVKYPSLNSNDCQIPWSETFITPAGKINIGCCSVFELGDITKNDFSAIWNNKTYRQLRKTVNSNKPMPPCRHDTCPFRKLI